MTLQIVIFGYGSVGSCVVDWLVSGTLSKRYGATPSLVVIDKQSKPKTFPKNVVYFNTEVTKQNISSLFNHLQTFLDRDAIIIDLMSGTRSLRMLYEACVKHGWRYINTSLDNWNYDVGYLSSLINTVAKYRKKWRQKKTTLPTALITHGMNPGIVSHFALVALSYLDKVEYPLVSKVHITEVDSQRPVKSKRLHSYTASVKEKVKNFGGYRKNVRKTVVTTWAPQNYVFEMNSFPSYARGPKTIHATQPATKIWSPSYIADPQRKFALMPYNGMTVEHEETFTLRNFFSERGVGNSKTEYRFIYRPCDICLQSLIPKHVIQRQEQGGGARRGRLIQGGDDVVGYDTVGVLIETPSKKIWVGNACTPNLHKSNKLLHKHNATVTQVVAGVLSGLWFVLNHPTEGVLFPEEVDEISRNIMLQMAEDILGKIQVTIESLSV